MKAAKFLLVLSVISLSVGCGNNSNENSYEDGDYTENSGGFFGSSKGNLKTFAFKDAKTGMVVYQKKFPANWNVKVQPSYTLDQDFPSFLYNIQGENGLMAFNSGIRQFIAYQDQQTAQMMQSYGMKNINNIVPIQSIIQSEVTPNMQKEGFRLVTTYRENSIFDYINKKKAEKGFQQAQADVVAAEWTNNAGKKAVTYVFQLVLPNRGAQAYENFAIWNYAVDYMVTSEGDFETDKSQFLASAMSEEENPQWEQYRASVSQRRQQQQIAQHQQRMRNNQIAFEQHQNNMRQRSAAMDASHQQFMDNLRGTSTSYGGGYSSDASHNSFINMIREEETVNYNGNSYQVDAGADQYWMNSNNEYIMSNDAFYNPNADNSVNNYDWQEVSPE